MGQDTTQHGTVSRDGGTLRLRYERHLAHPPEAVWRALTESSSLRHWFPADIVGEWTAGAAIQLPFWPEGAQESLDTLEKAGVDTTTMDLDEVLPGLIRTYEPPRLFEFVWGNPDEEQGNRPQRSCSRIAATASSVTGAKSR